MPSKTKIEWADYISNPIKARYEGKQGHACVRVSEGCARCWASTFNVRLGTGLEYTMPNLSKVEMFLDHAELMRLLSFKPRGPFKNGRDRALVFPFDMTDVFGEFINPYWIERCFAIFAERQDVDFLVLTKRPERMMEFVQDWTSKYDAPWNVYFGTSIENDKRAVERWSAMSEINEMYCKTVVSYEPALGVVEWNRWNFLNGLICGGESGHGARMMHPDWARGARDFCQAYGIPFFFKQWGEWVPVDHLAWVTDETTFAHQPIDFFGTMMCRVGKVKAGHVLDGEEWREMPGKNDELGVRS